MFPFKLVNMPWPAGCLKPAGVAVAVLLIAAGCTSRVENRGHVVDETAISQLEPGRQTRNQVTDLLGTPSSVTTFAQRQDIWYYISRRTEQTAFFTPDVTDQKIFAIAFDDSGRISDIRQFGLEDNKEIDFVDRQTPTRGKELGLLEQLFGNIGRFNNPNPPSNSF